MSANYWQGKNIRLRAIEPSDAEVFYRWNLESEMGRNLDFLWPPTSRAQTNAWIEEASKKKLLGECHPKRQKKRLR